MALEFLTAMNAAARVDLALHTRGRFADLGRTEQSTRQRLACLPREHRPVAGIAERNARFCATAALIERHLFGGTCVNAGCTPTKAMVANAHAAHLARRGGDFGFDAGRITVDLRAVKARKDAIVMKSRNSVEGWVRGTKNCTVFNGHGRFEGPKTIRVGDDLLEARHIFLNVGARPSVPNMPGVDSVPFLTSTRILDVEELPRHLVVVGGPIIVAIQTFRGNRTETTAFGKHVFPQFSRRTRAGVAASHACDSDSAHSDLIAGRSRAGRDGFRPLQRAAYVGQVQCDSTRQAYAGQSNKQGEHDMFGEQHSINGGNREAEQNLPLLSPFQPS